MNRDEIREAAGTFLTHRKRRYWSDTAIAREALADFAILQRKAEREEIAAELKQMRQSSPGLNKTSHLGQLLQAFIEKLESE